MPDMRTKLYWRRLLKRRRYFLPLQRELFHRRLRSPVSARVVLKMLGEECGDAAFNVD